MKRGFLGGTFNPPHLGHVRAAAAAQAQLGLDVLYVIPAGIPPHKELPADGAEGEQRREMSQAGFGGIPGVLLLDWELRRPGRSYTAETVERLLAEEPEGELWMLCGTDMFETLPDWYRGDWLLKTLHIAAYPRKAGEEAKLLALAESYRQTYGTVTEIIAVEPLEVSSTLLRGLLREGRGAEYLPLPVYGLILKHRLYGVRPEPGALWQLAEPWYKPGRIPHVQGTRETAVRLAERWGEDPLDAETAAILHDITKRMPEEEQLQLCKKCDIIIPNFSDDYLAMLHAYSGAAAAALEFGVSDRVRDAIMWHTTGRAGMTLLEKIIWLADYIEPGRTTAGVDEVRALAFADLDAALRLAMEHSIDYMEGAGFRLHPATREALAFLS